MPGRRTWLVGVALVLAYLGFRYLRYCRHFVAHEIARVTREPGYSGGINSTS